MRYNENMISQLSGTVSCKGAGFLVISAGAVGYKVYTPQLLLSKIKERENLLLWTHLAVRENAMELYGFSSQEEVDFFEMLMTVSGIGPRSGLAIINLAPVETLARAIGAGDTAYLTKVSGIGKKTAGKIVVELKDKMRKTYGEMSGGNLGAESETIEVLKALGYSTEQARSALHEIGAERQKNPKTAGLGVSETIKEALKILSQSRS